MALRRQLRSHHRDQVVELGVDLEVAKLFDADGAGHADATQIIARQIHEHDVLGVLFDAPR